MKILGISGSPRSKNTDYMINKVIESSGLDGEIIFLRDMKISPCTACRICSKGLKCSQNDDMQNIREKILCADIIILGSPTYFDNVSGMMKNFIDRCLPFYFSRELKGKKAVLLSVGNFKEDLEFDENGKCKWHKEEEESVLKCIKAMEDFSKILGLEIIEKVYALHGDAKEIEEELINLGKRLRQSLNN